MPDSANIIPFVPPARLRSEITLTLPKSGKTFHNAYFRFGVFHSFEQSNPYQISSVYYGLTKIDPTPAYTLLNIGIGTEVMARGRKACSIYLNVDNLTDVNYTDYMSRFKYIMNTVNGVDQKYVNNMGRNISIKVFIPLDFSKRKS